MMRYDLINIISVLTKLCVEGIYLFTMHMFHFVCPCNAYVDKDVQSMVSQLIYVDLYM